MKPVLWYFLVLLNIFFLIYSFFAKSLILAAIAFVMAIGLSNFTDEIPLPKAYTKIRLFSSKKDKYYDENQKQ